MKIITVNEEKPTKIFFFGGYINKHTQLCNDAYIYDIEDNHFTAINNFDLQEIPAKRTDHSLTNFEENIYVFGGASENKKILGDFYKFSLKNMKWKAIKGEGVRIQPRFGHTACSYENSMYLFGGWDGLKCLNDFYQYSFLTNIWYELKATSGEKPSARYRQEGIVYQNSLYIFGGVDDSQTRFNDLYQFYFERKEWRKIITSGCIPSPRTFHRLVNFENLLICVGGFDGERKNDLFFLSLGNNENIEEEKFSLSRMISLREEQEDDFSTGKISEQTAIQILTKKVKELSEKLQVEEERHLCKVFF